MLIDEYENIPWEKALAPPHIFVSSFCVRKGLGRKALMARYLDRHIKKCGAACPLAAGLPTTAVIDTMTVFGERPAYMDMAAAWAETLLDADELMSEAEAAAGRPVPWILKPSLTNKAAEITIVRTIPDVKAALRACPDMGQWVLQRYIEKPLLISRRSNTSCGHKFHIRVYVLAAGALIVWVYGEGLLLLAVAPYPRNREHDDGHGSNVSIGTVGSGAAATSAPDAEEEFARRAHITNTCVGVDDPEFDEAAHVRTMSELPSILVDDGIASDAAAAQAITADVWAQIHAITAHSFAAVETHAGVYMPLANGFELYGVDFLVDADLRVHLLEFNPSPDVKQTGSRLDWVIAGLMEGVAALAVDPQFPPPVAINAELRTISSDRSTAPAAVGERREPLSGGVAWTCVYHSRRWSQANGKANVRVADG